MLRKCGLGPEQALAINPRLIYCEMSGFGSDNPRSGRPAYDPVIQAASGMMSLNGEAEQDYLRVGPPLIDYGCGAQTAFAIAAALYQREHSGRGQIIESNMFDAALLMMSPHVSNAVQSGKTDTRSGNIPPQRPGYSVYACRDDKLMIGAFTLKHHRRLFDLLDLNERLAVPPEVSRDWIATNAEAIRREIAACLAMQDADSWELQMNAADIPAARVRDLHRVMAEDQSSRAQHSQFERFPDRDITAPIAGFRYAESGPDLELRCARHGEDTQRVLLELGYDEAEIEQLSQAGVVACSKPPGDA